MGMFDKIFGSTQAVDILSPVFPLPVFQISNHGDILAINQGALSTFGLQQEAVLNRNYFAVCHEYGIEVSISSLDSVINSKETFFYTGASIVKQDGGATKCALNWFVLKTKPHNQSKSFYLLGNDVTHATQESSSARSVNRIIIDHLPNFSIFWKDADSRFLGCNQTFANLAGLKDPEDIAGLTDYDLPWTKEESDSYVADDKVVMDSGNPKLDIEEPQTLEDGREIVLSTSKVPLRNESGEICGVIAIYNDVTDKKNKERQLIYTQVKLENALNARTEFVRNIRHDIRTPLTGISEIGRQLNEGTLSPEQMCEYGQDIQVAADELMELLNQIIDMAESSSQVEERNNKFVFNELLNSILKIYKLPVRQKNLKLISHYDDDIPELLVGKNLRLHKILLNLVGNAIKFTEKGTIEITSTLAKKSEMDVVLKLVVKDTGVGIPKDMQETVFEPLVRLNPSYTGIHKGSGMGLSYVKEHIENMGGEIYLDSTPDEGSTFTCIFPLKLPLLKDSDEEEFNHPYPEHTNKTVPSTSKSSFASKNDAGNAAGNILLVEDNLLAQKTTKNTLHEFGYNVDIAVNGKDALQLAKEKPYDIIYMDIGLPDISGIEVAKLIRNEDASQNKETLIVALTAHADDEVKNQALSAGMQRVFSKPLTPDKLETTQQSVKYKMEANELPIIDWKLWLRRVHGNEELANDTFTMLIDELPEDKTLIEKAIANNDAKELSNITHKMKGGLCYCGLPALEQRVLMLHEAAKQGDTENIESLYRAVLDAIHQVEEVYAERKKQMGSS